MPIPPESGPAFEQLMREVDAALAKDGVAISARPIHAVMAVGNRFKVSLPVVPLSPDAPAELAKYNDFVRNIQGWFEKVYGDRIKADFSPGSTVVPIDGDLYVLRLPRFYGTVQFMVSRQFVKRRSSFSRGPAVCNVLELIQNLSEAKAALLSDETLSEVMQMFGIGLQAHDALEANRSHDLIRLARGDVQTAVNSLMDRDNRFAESKWASLQAAEKTLKAAIAMEGAKFGFTHNLSTLCEQLCSLGVRFEWKDLVERIQCTPHIRYGSEYCSRDNALLAHQASLRLVVTLLGAGAKFKQSLSSSPKRV